MARYRDRFVLDPVDIERIERALRTEISQHVRTGELHPAPPESRAEVRAITELLAKIHHQKVFYSQVARTGVPGG